MTGRCRRREALRAGKNVWVEKPLALTEADLDATMAVTRSSSGLLAVGFNRRFAPLAVRLRAALVAQSGPRRFTVEINAGRLPANHWTLDPRQGGGRIVGEACHFVDLLRFLSGSAIATAITPMILQQIVDAMTMAGEIGGDPTRKGVWIGTGIGGLTTLEENVLVNEHKGARRVVDQAAHLAVEVDGAGHPQHA